MAAASSKRGRTNDSTDGDGFSDALEDPPVLKSELDAFLAEWKKEIEQSASSIVDKSKQEIVSEIGEKTSKLLRQHDTMQQRKLQAIDISINDLQNRQTTSERDMAEMQRQIQTLSRAVE